VTGAPWRSCNLCGSTDARLRHRVGGYSVVECNICHLVFVGETVPGDVLEAYYGSAYYTGGQPDGYGDYGALRESRTAHFRSLLPWLRAHLPTPSPRVLELGSAYGFFLEVVREQGWTGIGVELSDHAASQARARGLDVRTGTLDAVALPEASFDLVALWDVIEHLPDPAAAVRRVARLLRPGGVLALATGDVSGFTARAFGARWGLLAPPGHLYYFSRRTLRALLEQSGFEWLGWRSDGAFLLNDGPPAPGAIARALAAAQQLRVVHGVLRRLRLGSIMFVQARRR
jgi:SAM-dependent methyltransferase